MDAWPGGLSEELRAVGAGPVPATLTTVLRLDYVTNQSTFMLTATCGHGAPARGLTGVVIVHSGQDRLRAVGRYGWHLGVDVVYSGIPATVLLPGSRRLTALALSGQA